MAQDFKSLTESQKSFEARGKVVDKRMLDLVSAFTQLYQSIKQDQVTYC